MEVRYRNNGKTAEFNGLRYTRDDKTNLYLNSTHRKRLHRAVWEFHNGVIPDGYHIHHKDNNRLNNSIDNLDCIEGLRHWTFHRQQMASEDQSWRRENLNRNARPAASKWHASDQGREWHKKHYEAIKDKLHQSKEYVCENCGRYFKSTKTGTKFCSNKCKSAYRRKLHLDDEVRKCVFCGKTFTVNKYSRVLSCSRSCASKFGKKRGLANDNHTNRPG